jgi:hypothetical protein
VTVTLACIVFGRNSTIEMQRRAINVWIILFLSFLYAQLMESPAYVKGSDWIIRYFGVGHDKEPFVETSKVYLYVWGLVVQSEAKLLVCHQVILFVWNIILRWQW